jgi:Kef-type K+ transport system membrane component KefB
MKAEGSMTHGSRRLLAAVNYAVFICMVVVWFSVDGNGEVFGLPETLSYGIGVSLYCAGIVLSTILGIKSKRHRIGAVICLMVYLMMAPTMLPPARLLYGAEALRGESAG